MAIFQPRTAGMKSSPQALLSKETFGCSVSYLQHWSHLAKVSCHQRGSRPGGGERKLLELAAEAGEGMSQEEEKNTELSAAPCPSHSHLVSPVCGKSCWQSAPSHPGTDTVYYEHRSSLGGCGPPLSCPGSISLRELSLTVVSPSSDTVPPDSSSHEVHDSDVSSGILRP